jgi:hypothetical protein
MQTKNIFLVFLNFHHMFKPLQAYFLFRQADYISQVAAIDGSLSGIEHWWIGLTDLGK